MSTIVAIDTETTGLGHKANPRGKDGIVQVGILLGEIKRMASGYWK